MFIIKCSELSTDTKNISLFDDFKFACYVNYFFLIIFKVILKISIFFIIWFILSFAAPLLREFLAFDKIPESKGTEIKTNVPSILKDDTSKFFIVLSFLMSNIVLLYFKYYDSYFISQIINSEEIRLLKFFYSRMCNIYENPGITMNSLINKYKKFFFEFHQSFQKIITNTIVSLLLFGCFFLQSDWQIYNFHKIDLFVYLIPLFYQLFLFFKFIVSTFEFYEFIKNFKFSDSDLIKDFNTIKSNIFCKFSLNNISNTLILIFVLIKFSKFVNQIQHKKEPKQDRGSSQKLKTVKSLETMTKLTNQDENKQKINQEINQPKDHNDDDSQLLSPLATSFMFTFILCGLFNEQKLFNFDTNMSDFAKYFQLYIGLKHLFQNIKLIDYHQSGELVVEEEDDIYIKHLELRSNIWAKNHFKNIEVGTIENFRFKNIAIDQRFENYINYIFGLTIQIPKRSIYINNDDISQYNFSNHVLFLDKNFVFFYPDKSVIENLEILFPDISKEEIIQCSEKYLTSTDINLPYSYLSNEEKEICLIILSKISKKLENYFLITNSIKCFEFYKDIPIKVYTAENFDKLPDNLTKRDCYTWFCKSLNKLEE